MTKLLDEAIAKLKMLSEDEQNRAAEMLLAFAADPQEPSGANKWLLENQAAIVAYNKRVVEGSILSDLDRAF